MPTIVYKSGDQAGAGANVQDAPVAFQAELDQRVDDVAGRIVVRLDHVGFKLCNKKKNQIPSYIIVLLTELSVSWNTKKRCQTGFFSAPYRRNIVERCWGDRKNGPVTTTTRKEASVYKGSVS